MKVAFENHCVMCYQNVYKTDSEKHDYSKIAEIKKKKKAVNYCHHLEVFNDVFFQCV